MSKPRFKLYAEVDTMAHANTIKNNIQNQLVGKDIFEEHSLSAFDDTSGLSGKILVVAEWRFNNAIDRDAMREWIKDQVQNHPQVKIWVSVAKLSWHRCTHDDATVENCTTTNYAEWNK
jgi:hypothetical protein